MTPLQQLTELKWKHDCTKTSMRHDYVPRDKFTDKTSGGLEKAIVMYINLTGGFARVLKNTGRYMEGKDVNVGFYGIKRTKGKFVKGSGTNGESDVIADYGVTSHSIEVKIGKDRMSDDQKEFKRRKLATGGSYITVKTFNDFLEQWGVITGVKPFIYNPTGMKS